MAKALRFVPLALALLAALMAPAAQATSCITLTPFGNVFTGGTQIECSANTVPWRCQNCAANANGNQLFGQACTCCVNSFAPNTGDIKSRASDACLNMMSIALGKSLPPSEKSSALVSVYNCLVNKKDSANHVYACQNCLANKQTLTAIRDCSRCVQRIPLSEAPWSCLN